MLSSFEKKFEEKIASLVTAEDPAHDLLHFKRVVACAKKLSVAERADLRVVVPAAWLHDLVIVDKASPLRSKASRMSAEKAIEYLKSISYPDQFYTKIFNAIEAHSFSAGVKPESVEAGVVQDADRLDALGAIGIARCFTVAGQLKRSLYRAEDSFCSQRDPDDSHYTIDHFYKKLLLLSDTMQTAAGRKEALRRTVFMQTYLDELKVEL
jgi:uncharacterized protein